MGYAILRTQKLKSGLAVRRSLMHAFREQETPNADPDRASDNTHIGATGVGEALAAYNARMATQAKVRVNAVHVIEYLITASPEDLKAKPREQQDAYFRDALQWLRDKHGAENVVYAGIHRDETTPHMYAYVVPIDDKGKLNCRAFLGGTSHNMSKMQTEFAQKVGQQHGLERGIENSKAKHVTIRQYYSRMKKDFEPLPEVKTPVPKLRPEPEKPGLFAGKQAKEDYEYDHEQWERERDKAERLRQQHMAEVKAQRDAAVEIAQRYQPQAREALALKGEVRQLKAANSAVAKKAAKLAEQAAIAELFTPEEIERARLRKQQQHDQVKRQQAEKEKAERVRIEKARRVQGIQQLLQRGGAAHTFGVHAATALRMAGGDPDKVGWMGVEAAAAVEAMAKHGQTSENVLKALLAHSPGRADPDSHASLRADVARIAPGLEAQYARQQVNRDQGQTPGMR
jgi:hypothetical protein